MLPNATIATITFLPFSLSASVTALSGLDFLGFGPSLDLPHWKMVNQGEIIYKLLVDYKFLTLD